MTTIGDLGCQGVDVDDWRKRNRVPLFPGKVNRWVLIRTTRDDPTPDDLKNTLAAVFSKWFEGTVLDPALVFKGTTRSATADLIKLEKVSKDRLSVANPARRREDLPGVSPTVAPGNFVWLEVTFAYRGQQTDMPWPVRTGAAMQLTSSAQCPIGADWVLDSAQTPTENAPPEQSSGDKAREVVADTADTVTSGLFSLLWVPLAAIGVAAVLVLRARRA
ncbi:MAG TPA: hypothetical protein VHW01_18990 [Polyangiaceae bacterium]|nr:hypothetical protein [Polyangiaceae bacterium]